MSDMMN